jgi:hypothetical protein
MVSLQAVGYAKTEARSQNGSGITSGKQHMRRLKNYGFWLLASNKTKTHITQRIAV